MWQARECRWTVVLACLAAAVQALPAFLGVGGRGGAGASLTGASFTFLPQDPVFHGISSVSGKSLQVDLDKLSVSVSHGTLAFSPQGINFTRGHGTWNTELFDERVETKRNGVSVMQMTASERLGIYSFKYFGQGQFSDILLDKGTLTSAISTICMADRRAVGLGKRDADSCPQDTARVHLSLSQVVEQIAKVLLSLSDTASGQSEQLQKRLQKSYDEVLKSIQDQLQLELGTIKQSFEAYDAWQTLQRETQKQIGSAEQVRTELLANIALVEGRQESLTAEMRDLGAQTTSNFSVLSANLTQFVDASLAVLHDIALNDTAVLVDAASHELTANLAAVDERVTTSLLRVAEVGASHEGLREQVNQSLNALQASVTGLHSSISEAVRSEHLNIVELLDGSQKQLQSDLGSRWQARHDNLTQQIADVQAALEGLAAGHRSDLGLLTNALDALPSSFATRLDELRNSTRETLDTQQKVLSANSSRLDQRLDQLNSSVCASLDALSGNTQTIRQALVALDAESTAQREALVNNISSSIAHSNGIFAKVFREMNTSLLALRGELESLQNDRLPELLTRVAQNASEELALERLSSREAWTRELFALRAETQANTTQLQTHLSSTVAAELGALNQTLSAHELARQLQHSALRAELTQVEVTQTAALGRLRNETFSQLQETNWAMANANTKWAAEHAALNESFTARASVLDKSLENAIDALQQQVENRSSTLRSSIAAVTDLSAQGLGNLSASLHEAAAHYNESLHILQDYVLNELIKEGEERAEVVRTLKIDAIAANASLFNSLTQVNESLRSELAIASVATDMAMSALARSQSEQEVRLSQRLGAVQDEVLAFLLSNATSLREMLEAAAVEASRNHSSLHEQLTAAHSNWTASHVMLEGLVNASHARLADSQAESHGNMSSALGALDDAFQRNVSALADQMLFENDHIMSLVGALEGHHNATNARELKLLQQVNASALAHIAVLSSNISALEATAVQAVQLLHGRVDKVQAELTSHATAANASLRALADELAHTNARWVEEWKVANATTASHLLALMDDVASVARELSAHSDANAVSFTKHNTTVQAALVALDANLSAGIASLRNQLQVELNASVTALTATETAHYQEMLEKLSSAMESTRSEIANVSAKAYAESKTLGQELELLRTESLNEQLVLQKHIDAIGSSVQALQTNTSLALRGEQEHRDALTKEVQDRLAASLQHTAAQLRESQVQTNMSLLQQQALIGVQAEQISQLQRGATQLEARDRETQKALHALDKTTSGLTSSVTDLQTRVSGVADQLSRISTEQLPGLLSDVGVLKSAVTISQSAQDVIQAELSTLRAKQLDAAGNLTILADRLHTESSDRKERLQALQTDITTRLDDHKGAVTSRIDVLQRQGDKDHKEIAQTVKTVATLSDKALVAAEDIVALKKRSIHTEVLEAEVGSLKGAVQDLKAQLSAQKAVFDSEVAELRSAKELTASVLTLLQKQMEQQAAAMVSMQREQEALKASCAERTQIDKLKDQLMGVQQGTLQQVASILQLVQQQQQQQLSKQ